MRAKIEIFATCNYDLISLFNATKTWPLSIEAKEETRGSLDRVFQGERNPRVVSIDEGCKDKRKKEATVQREGEREREREVDEACP